VGSIVFGIFLAFNLLYFLKVIPPVPLSLKDIGVYHSIERVEGGYRATYEEAPWWKFWREIDSTYTITTGSSAYCFSSVFAPSDLNAPIFHRWERLSEGGWVTISRISYPISGGRADGYRGFTQTGKLLEGAWRCNVETANGALIGRASFTVEKAGSLPELSTTSL
jgi:hypothetical protein